MKKRSLQLDLNGFKFETEWLAFEHKNLFKFWQRLEVLRQAETVVKLGLEEEMINEEAEN